MAEPRLGLVDSHVHLHSYADDAIDGMLERAAGAGVERVVAVAIDLPTARRNLELVDRHPERVLGAVGFHPSRLEGPVDDETWFDFERIARDDRVAAIGECGVDGVDGQASGTVQLAALAHQARLAAVLRKPLLLHLRGDELIGAALGVLAAIQLPPERAVVHYFVGDRALANRYLDAGLFIAVGKPVTRAENAELRAAIQRMPLTRLLLETDTYPLPGRMTEPADTRAVAVSVADLWDTSLSEVAMTTAENLRRLLSR